MYPKFNKNLNTHEIDVFSLDKRRTEPPFWTGGPQPQDPAPWANLGAFAAGAAVTVGFGAVPIGRGRRGVDLYYDIARKVEDFSPGKILRTFAISDVLFPFTKGATFSEVGMTVPRGGKITSALRAIYGAERIKRVEDVAEFKFGRSRMFGISAQLSPRTQRLIAIARAYAASQVNRFNTLLATTREVITHDLWRGFFPKAATPKTPFRYTWKAREYVVKQLGRAGLVLPKRLLAVRQGPALKMLAGLTAKASLFYLGYHGLNYLDYLRRTEESRLVTTAGGALAGAGYFAALFRNPKAAITGAIIGAAIGLLPAFDEGIYAGFAGLYTKGRLLHAKFSDYLGLTEAAREQEELAPGITDWKTPLGFAGAGGLLTGVFLKPALQKFGIKTFAKMGFVKGAYTGLGVYGALALGAAFLTGSILPGLFGADYTHDELKKIYSGEKQIPIRKGRWWEFGRTPWEGTKVDYYRQHWYPRLLSRAKDISLYGSEEEKWAYDPILHPIKAIFDEEFKYHRELKNYHSRPYPISGTYFEDIPFLGPTIAGTLGKLIKPTRYMHTEKWLRQGPGGELEARYVPSAGKHEPSFELGGLKPGLALEGYDVTGVIGDQIYRLNELRGLTGFMHGSVKEALTGSQDYFDDAIRLESSSRAYGSERAYWDLNLGGLLGMCFVKGTKIKTTSKIKTIENVKIGDKVLTHGEWKTVIDKIIKKPASRIIEICSQGAGVNLKCTDNHWIPILRRGRYKNGHIKPWSVKNYNIIEIQAKDIQEGDYLFYEIDNREEEGIIDLAKTGKSYTDKYVYKRASYFFAKAWEYIEVQSNLTRKQLRELHIPDLIAKEVLRQFRLGIKPARIKRFFKITPDLAYFIGWYIAEGCSDGTKLRFTMHSKEVDYARKLAQIANKLGFNNNIRIKDNTLILDVFSSQLARYFKIFGERSANKRIPQQFKNLKKDILSELINGLILGDGWTGGFTSVSRQLVVDLFECLLKLKKPSYLTLDYKEEGKGRYPQGTLRKGGIRHYLEFRSDKLNWRFIDNSFLVSITEIKEVKKEDYEFVYDLTIEDLHHYTAEGVRVHNTEAFRRYLPHRRRQIELYNPIPNQAASWLPGSNYYIDFKHGDPFCVSEDTLIEVNNNETKKACDICIGDIVKSHVGNYIPIKNIIKRPINNEKCYQIKVTTLASYPIKVSSEHPFLTTKGWEKAQELKVGDYIGYPLTTVDWIDDIVIDLSKYSSLPKTDKWIYIQGAQQYADCVNYIENNNNIKYKWGELSKILKAYGWKRKTYENAQRGIRYKSLNRIPRYIKLGKEFGIIAGYYLSEGSVNESSIHFAFHEKEKNYIKELDEAFNTLFNRKGNVYKSKALYNGRLNRGINYLITCKAIAEILANIFGKGFANKDLPIFDRHKEFEIHLIRTLFNGDGSFYLDNNKPRLSLKLQNPKLIRKIRSLLLDFGFVGSITDKNQLIIRGQQAKNCSLFFNTKYIPCLDSSREVKHYYLEDDYIWMRIFDIREIVLDEVYGFEVDQDDSFCVYGIATHNTKIPEGELRLPGRGYATQYPELKGVHPEEYPLMHKFRILADVAMWSDEFKEVRGEIQKLKRRGELTIQEQEMVRETLTQVSERKKKKQFKEYKFAADNAAKTEITIKKQIGRGRFLTEEFGDVALFLAGINLSEAAIARLARQREGGTLKERREDIRTDLEKRLEEVIQPGTKLEVLIPRDPLTRYKLGARDVSMPAIVYNPQGINVNRALLHLKLAEGEEGPLSQYVEYSPAQRLFGTAWELITHKGELPTEYLLPFAPFGKFIHARSALEEYERTQVFGTESAFWQHPIAHFIKPFARTMRGLVDESYIPEEIQHRRELQEYFDKLKYIKYSRLADIAEKTEQQEVEQKALEIRRQTLFGLDPYGSFRDILKALPGTERDFFTAFSNAKTPEERERILQLIPENERRIYIARWQGQLARQLVAEYKTGISRDSIQLLRQISKLKKTEGRPWTLELQTRYEEEVEDKTTYADWYREKELEAYFQHRPLPGPNWIGWHPKVDLEDIKLKVVETLGEDMHDYGLWQSRARTLHRKPYIDEAALSAIMKTPAIDRGDVAKQLRELMDGFGISNVQITSHHLHQLNQENLIDIELTDDRQEEIRSIVERL